MKQRALLGSEGILPWEFLDYYRDRGGEICEGNWLLSDSDHVQQKKPTYRIKGLLNIESQGLFARMSLQVVETPWVTRVFLFFAVFCCSIVLRFRLSYIGSLSTHIATTIATIEAASNPKVRSPRPVISTVRTVPVRGALTQAENNVPIPITAQANGLTPRLGSKRFVS